MSNSFSLDRAKHHKPCVDITLENGSERGHKGWLPESINKHALLIKANKQNISHFSRPDHPRYLVIYIYYYLIRHLNMHTSNTAAENGSRKRIRIVWERTKPLVTSSARFVYGKSFQQLQKTKVVSLLFARRYFGMDYRCAPGGENGFKGSTPYPLFRPWTDSFLFFQFRRKYYVVRIKPEQKYTRNITT